MLNVLSIKNVDLIPKLTRSLSCITQVGEKRDGVLEMVREIEFIFQKFVIKTLIINSDINRIRMKL